MFKKVMFLVFVVVLLSLPLHGGEWLPETLLVSNPAGDIQPSGLRLVVDQANNIHITYDVYPWNIHYVKSDYNGNILVPDLLISSESGHPDIALDNSGNVHIAISHAGELWYTKLDNNGNTLVPQFQVLSLESGHIHSSIDCDSYGNLHIIFWNFNGLQAGGHYVKLDNSGNILIGPIKFSVAGGGWGEPSLDVDISNNVHITWLDDAGEGVGIYYLKMNDNAENLISTMKVSTGGSASNKPSICADSDGKACLVWSDQRDGNDEIYYAKVDQSGSLEVDNMRITYNDSISFWPHVAVDPNNNIHIAWNDYRDDSPDPYMSEIYYSMLNSEGQIIIDNQRLSTPSSDSYVGDIVIDNFGNPVLVLTHSQNVYFKRQQTPSYPDLIGYWKFEEEDGNIAYDSSLYDNHGALFGDPTRMEGLPLLGKALDLDGTDDYVKIPNAPELEICAPFTIMAWIYPESLPAGTADSEIASFVNKWMNYILQTGKQSGKPGRLRIVVQNSEGAWHPLESDSCLVLNNWQHIVGLWDGDSLKLYKNGVHLVSQYIGPFIPGPYLEQALYIGTEKATWQFFDGLMDEIKIYNRAFSLEDIIEEFESGFIRGDANFDGTINVSDAVYIINYIFAGGPSPDPLQSGDANCDGTVNVSDAVYIINYIFAGGPEPGCP